MKNYGEMENKNLTISKSGENLGLENSFWELNFLYRCIAILIRMDADY